MILSGMKQAAALKFCQSICCVFLLVLTAVQSNAAIKLQMRIQWSRIQSGYWHLNRRSNVTSAFLCQLIWQPVHTFWLLNLFRLCRSLLCVVVQLIVFLHLLEMSLRFKVTTEPVSSCLFWSDVSKSDPPTHLPTYLPTYLPTSI
jgi:hypothetical protein